MESTTGAFACVQSASLARATVLAAVLSLLPTWASAAAERADRPGLRLAELPAAMGRPRAGQFRNPRPDTHRDRVARRRSRRACRARCRRRRTRCGRHRIRAARRRQGPAIRDRLQSDVEGDPGNGGGAVIAGEVRRQAGRSAAKTHRGAERRNRSASLPSAEPRKPPRAGWRRKAASIPRPTSRSRRSAARLRCRRRWRTSASTRSCCRRPKAISRPDRAPAPSWFRSGTTFRCWPTSPIWCSSPRSRSTTRRPG